MKCISCQQEFTQGISFDCPGCGKERIARCLQCKKLNIAYSCDCGYEGP